MRLQNFSIAVCFISLFLSCLQSEAQVTIGSEYRPVHGSLLDLKEENTLNENSRRGLLMPRVALQDVIKMGPCINSDEITAQTKSSHVGLAVYNVTDSLSVGLCPGIYVWEGEFWTRLPEPCGSDPSSLNSANCYIVASGSESEEIPVNRAYIASESRSDLTPLDKSHKVSLQILWQDTPSLINSFELIGGDKGHMSTFKVKANSGKTGNALVALHVGPNGNDSDPIAWSWHIWVTDYDPNSIVPNDYGPNTTGTGAVYKYKNGDKDYIFMDRNLGATNTSSSDINSMGMTYQWGRKDPFTAANGNWTHEVRTLYSYPDNTLLEEINEVLPSGGTQPSGNGIKHIIPPAGSSNLNLSIQNPMTFYHGSYIKGNDLNFDWYSGDNTGSISDNTLWGTATEKSIFDPCPAGWRVPAYNGNNSPWYPYLGGDNGGWGGWGGDDVEGFSIIGGKGFNFVGNTSRTALGYYPAGLSRAARSFFTGGPVGSSDEYPSSVGGGFYIIGYENERIEAHYWSSTTSDNIKAKLMRLGVGMMGNSEITEVASPKATGAAVRCVKE